MFNDTPFKQFAVIIVFLPTIGEDDEEGGDETMAGEGKNGEGELTAGNAVNLATSWTG